MQQCCVLNGEVSTGEAYEFVAKENPVTVYANGGVCNFVQKSGQGGGAPIEANAV
jgi:hypothetical protein